MVQRGLNKILLTGALVGGLSVSFGLSELLYRTTGYDSQEYIKMQINKPSDSRILNRLDHIFDRLNVSPLENNIERTYDQCNQQDEIDYILANNNQQTILSTKY